MMQPDPATEWFAVRGYSLRFWAEDSAVWVDLILIRTGVVSWPRYGKGNRPWAPPSAPLSVTGRNRVKADTVRAFVDADPSACRSNPLYASLFDRIYDLPSVAFVRTLNGTTLPKPTTHRMTGTCCVAQR